MDMLTPQGEQLKNTCNHPKEQLLKAGKETSENKTTGDITIITLYHCKQCGKLLRVN